MTPSHANRTPFPLMIAQLTGTQKQMGAQHGAMTRAVGGWEATLDYYGDCPAVRQVLDVYGTCMLSVPCDTYDPDAYDPAETPCADSAKRAEHGSKPKYKNYKIPKYNTKQKPNTKYNTKQKPNT